MKKITENALVARVKRHMRSHDDRILHSNRGRRYPWIDFGLWYITENNRLMWTFDNCEQLEAFARERKILSDSEAVSWEE